MAVSTKPVGLKFGSYYLPAYEMSSGLLLGVPRFCLSLT